MTTQWVKAAVRGLAGIWSATLLQGAVAACIFMVAVTASVLRAQSPAADLRVTGITAAPVTPQTGSSFTYTISLANNGPNAATGVVVTDMLPPQVSFVPGGSCSENCGTVTCQVAGSLTGTTTVVFTVLANQAGSARNVAGIAGNEFDSDLTNNSVYVDTTINLGPGPTVSGITPVRGSTAGGALETIRGSNFFGAATVTFGGVPATNVTVVDSTTITAVTPPNVCGILGVVVTNPDGQTPNTDLSFEYVCCLACRPR